MLDWHCMLSSYTPTLSGRISQYYLIWTLMPRYHNYHHRQNYNDCYSNHEGFANGYSISSTSCFNRGNTTSEGPGQAVTVQDDLQMKVYMDVAFALGVCSRLLAALILPLEGTCVS
jgi:hypothetical protein